MKYFFGFLGFFRKTIHRIYAGSVIEPIIEITVIVFMLLSIPLAVAFGGNLPILKLITLLLIIATPIITLIIIYARCLKNIDSDRHSALTAKNFKTFYSISPDRFAFSFKENGTPTGDLYYRTDDTKPNGDPVEKHYKFRTRFAYLRALYFAKEHQGIKDLEIIANCSRADVEKLTEKVLAEQKKIEKEYENAIQRANSSFADDFPTLATPTREAEKPIPQTPEPPPETEKSPEKSSEPSTLCLDTTHYCEYLGKNITDKVAIRLKPNP